jgi:1-acyl-sn-glycerol-3-phosphate acyltransferase
MKRFLANLLLYKFHIGFVRPLLKWGIGVRYRRAGLVPRGPCIVVSNHNSHLDAAVLMTLFPLRRLPHVHPVAAADYFGKTWILRALAMLLMNGIPIERRPRAGSDPLEPMKSLVFFPEGSRGKAGVVAPFRPGIGRLVHKMPGLLVVPVFLSGPERIWPRGQFVPVPLAIDAIIGKPRTYSPDDDPREIAEQVQRDVLALAPPPPPRPGSRPRPVRVAVCGLDTETRHHVFEQLCRRLGRSDRTLGIADPVVEADAEGLREVPAPIPQPRVRAWLGALARIFRTGGRFQGEKFAEMIDRAQIDEALGTRPAARFVVTDGSALVDLLAWAEADFYHGVFDESGMNHLRQYLSGQRRIPLAKWWSFIRKAPEVWLINTFDLARPPVPDVLVFVHLPAARLMERLRLRGEELGPHDNEPFFRKLHEGYRQVSRVLSKRSKVEYLDFDWTGGGLDALIDELEEVCLRLTETETTPAAN